MRWKINDKTESLGEQHEYSRTSLMNIFKPYPMGKSNQSLAYRLMALKVILIEVNYFCN